jgi:hypothetical protein
MKYITQYNTFIFASVIYQNYIPWPRNYYIFGIMDVIYLSTARDCWEEFGGVFG